MMRPVNRAVQAQRNSPREVQRNRHPLLLRVVGIVAFLMFGFGGYLTQWLTNPAAFPIKKIAVEGEFNHMTSEHVQAVVLDAVDGGFFNVNVAAVRSRILDEPWVLDAAVRRVWPDTIRVSIHEQTAVARWGEHALLNRFADIFVPESSPKSSRLAVLDGPIGSESEMLSRYFETQKRLDHIGLRVTRMKLSERRAWVVEIKDGATLVLGRHAVDERLDRFSEAFDDLLKGRWTSVALVDLRYTNGFAIREKPAAADNG